MELRAFSNQRCVDGMNCHVSPNVRTTQAGDLVSSLLSIIHSLIPTLVTVSPMCHHWATTSPKHVGREKSIRNHKYKERCQLLSFFKNLS